MTSSLCAAAACLVLPTLAVAADLCAGHVTDREPRAVPSLPRPPYLRPYRDPAFGSRVTRISDTPRGEIVRTLYSTVQAWNADETRLLLYHTGGANAGHHLYDGRTYDYLGQLPFAAADIEEVFWDPERAPFLYYVQKKPSDDEFHGKLVRYDVRDGSRTAVADVSAFCGNLGTYVLPSAGTDAHGMSGSLIGLRCRNDAARGSENDITFHVDTRNGEIGASRTIGPRVDVGGGTSGSLPNVAVVPVPSGRRFLLQGSVFDAQMNFLRRVDMPLTRNAQGRAVPKTEHDSIGRLPNGHDALFTPQFDPGPAGCGVGTLVTHDLENGRCAVMLGPDTGWDYPLSGIHHSAVATRAPGWVATSVVGYGKLDFLENGRKAPTLFSEVALTRTDPNDPRTCRLAHLRTHGKSANRTARSAYFGEPHPVISPSGTRVLFTSDWYDSGTVDTFVIDLGGEASEPEPELEPDPEPSAGMCPVRPPR